MDTKRGRLIACLALLLGIILSLVGCRDPETVPEIVDTEQSDSYVLGSSETEKLEGSAEKTLTLMVYMVGSDLEAKTGAATGDLEEIAASGVDLQRCNVVIYAGGSPNWHNEVEAEHNSILELNENGFAVKETDKSRSMGDANCLTEFLNYCFENYQTEQYALILWNHGNGPIIGYGKDILFDNDTLTLQEMQEALQASPFGPKRQLSWVGFDACLMASAELACVWAPYAEYLAASQEIEPAFGWNYNFLSELGRQNTPILLSRAAEDYLSACLAYYEKKGFDHRDTTLAVLDLSKADALREAIDMLFFAAEKDVEDRYDELVSLRVDARAIGRISTGSEYDLVDLIDLAEQMRQVYPQEAETLQAAAEAMIVNNTTNTTGLGGVSLYYPFFNKDYYQKSWSQSYAALGAFPHYNDYLRSYETTWLGEDMLKEYAESRTPTQISANRFALELTEDQAKHFAAGKYYILNQTGEERYLRVFESSDVWLEGNTLYANYDGKVFIAQDSGTENVAYPVVDDLGIQDGRRFYAVLGVLSDTALSYDDPNVKPSLRVRILFSMDPETEELQYVSVQEDKSQLSKSGDISAGKQEDVDPLSYTTLSYKQEPQKLLLRDDNGVPLAMEYWFSDEEWMDIYAPFRSEQAFSLNRDYPMDDQFAIVYELQDTQGNRYCSEPIPIDAPVQQHPPITEDEHEPIRKRWSEGDSLELLSRDGISLSIHKVEQKLGDSICQKLSLQISNHTDENVTLFTEDGGFIYNDGILSNSYLSLDCPPGETVGGVDVEGFWTSDILDFGDLPSYTEKSIVLNSLSLNLSVYSNPYENFIIDDNRSLFEPIWKSERFEIEFTEPFTETEPPFFSKESLPTFLDAAISPQLLYESSELRVSITDFYVEPDLLDPSKGRALELTLLFENLSDHPVYTGCSDIVLNGVYQGNFFSTVCLPPGNKCYSHPSIRLNELGQDFDLKQRWCEINSIDRVQLGIMISESEETPILRELHWVDVKLTQMGSGEATFPEEGTRLLDENGVRVTLVGWEKDHDNLPQPVLAIENDSAQEVTVRLFEWQLEGSENVEGAQALLSERIGSGQKYVTAIDYYVEGTNTEDSQPVLSKLSFRFLILSGLQDKVLYLSERIGLECPDAELIS